MNNEQLKIRSGLMGVCVGDALGAPVEGRSRAQLATQPITTMTGYGTHQQPPGTWTDDSSLTFCLAEGLIGEFALERIARAFVRWKNAGYWTPYGQAFGIGNTTKVAIERLERGIPPLEAGSTQEWSNGNGSLMRSLPLAFLFQRLDFPTLLERVHQCSCITHAHPRAQMGCGIYISIAVNLLAGLDPDSAYHQGIQASRAFYSQSPFAAELPYFQRVLNGKIATLSAEAITTSAYVVSTLEASLWCFLTTQSYSEAVLKAVNLGEDTDTTAAVTGGLAGLYYGIDNIPREWREQIPKQDEIIDLADRLAFALVD